jgi:hypothetical protein
MGTFTSSRRLTGSLCLLDDGHGVELITSSAIYSGVRFNGVR